MSARLWGRAMVGFGGLWLAGCSSDPTLVNIRLSADGTVTAVSVVAVTVRQSDRQLSSLYRSLLSDTDSGAEPFRFPVTLAFNFVGGAAASATVTVGALDNSASYQQVASASGSVDVRPHKTVEIELLLSATTSNPPAGDAGADDAGEPDGSEPDSGGADDAGVAPDVAAEAADADDAEVAAMNEVADGTDVPRVIARPSSISMTLSCRTSPLSRPGACRDSFRRARPPRGRRFDSAPRAWPRRGPDRRAR